MGRIYAHGACRQCIAPLAMTLADVAEAAALLLEGAKALSYVISL